MKGLVTVAIVIIAGFMTNEAYCQTASGSAIIPSYQANYTSSTSINRSYISISNISESTVTVKVTLFNDIGVIQNDNDDDDEAGSLYVRNASTVSNWDDDGTDTSSDCSVYFDLAANNTVEIFVSFSGMTYGYGKIYWEKSSSKMSVALVANLRHYLYFTDETDMSTRTEFGVPINGGMPF